MDNQYKIDLLSSKLVLTDTNKLRLNSLRKSLFSEFVETNYQLLLSVYEKEFSLSLKEQITLEDWIQFAFNQTSTNGLRLYRD